MPTVGPASVGTPQPRVTRPATGSSSGPCSSRPCGRPAEATAFRPGRNERPPRGAGPSELGGPQPFGPDLFGAWAHRLEQRDAGWRPARPVPPRGVRPPRIRPPRHGDCRRRWRTAGPVPPQPPPERPAPLPWQAPPRPTPRWRRPDQPVPDAGQRPHGRPRGRCCAPPEGRAPPIWAARHRQYGFRRKQR